MTKKQYQRQLNFKQGYIYGYYARKPLAHKEKHNKPAEYLRGYWAARTDRKTGETPLYHAAFQRG